MSDMKETKLLDWISRNLIKVKRCNKNVDSHALRCLLEKDIEEHYTDEEFKSGMLEAGFNCCGSEGYYYFNVSKKNFIDIYDKINRRRRNIEKKQQSHATDHVTE